MPRQSIRKNNLFRKTVLAQSVALALGTAGAAPVLAQETADQRELEEVVVIGLRASLLRSVELKRNAAGIVDAISAEDIGKFPDTNLAESLQRITGVSISRDRGEGSEVTVRGFGPEYNLVTLNGRQMPTHNDVNRSFDFADLASEGIASVEVYKTGRAHVPTGGIGSAINIKTNKPLDAPGFKFTAGVKGVCDTSIDNGSADDCITNVSDWTPEVSTLISHTFADDTLGISLSASYQERDNGVNQGRVGGWRTQTGTIGGWGAVPQNADQVNRPGEEDIYAVPQVVAYQLSDYSRERLNGQLTLQWQPTDQLRGTLDYTYSEVQLEHIYSDYSAWFNFGGQETTFSNGPVATPVAYAENMDGTGDFAMGAGANATKNENTSLGFNLEYTPTDNLKLVFDYHDSTAEALPDSPLGSSSVISTAAFLRQKTSAYFADGDLPILSLDLSSPLTKDAAIITGSVFTNEVSEMDIEQFGVSGVWDASDEMSIDFGVQMTEVNNRSALANVQRDAWGGVSQPGAISDLLTLTSAADEFDQISGSGDSRRTTDFYTFDARELIARAEALEASGEATIWQTTLGDCGTSFCPSTVYDTDRRTDEESFSAYAQFNLIEEFRGIPINIHVGVRYEETDVVSRALVPTYSSVEWVAASEFPARRATDENGNVIQDFTQLEGSYDFWLPNVDIDFEPVEDLVVRLSYSHTLARPNYEDIQGGLTINGLLRVNGGTGSRGNPALLPLESKNSDVSVEYYFGESSYVSLGYFYKEVENFIGIDTVRGETLFSLPHPANGPLYRMAVDAVGSEDANAIRAYIAENFADEPGVEVSGEQITITGQAGRDDFATFDVAVPVNIENARLDGWEMAFQHTFGESGFGMIINYTKVDGNVGYDNASRAEQFVVLGLSDSANIIAFYDKNGIQARLAYNWRDDYLAGTGQDNVGTSPDGGPTYTEEFGQWDFSASYDFLGHFTVFVEGLNLLDETSHTYGRATEQVLHAVQTGARYNLGFRYKF